MTTLRRFGIGLVGAGIMARRMAAALQQHPRFHVAAVWDPDADAARRLAADFGPAACADSHQALALHAGVDAVYIASPPAFHLQGVRAAVAARRACLCEKPLAHTVADAQALRFARWPRPWQEGASAWLAGPAQGGFTREVLSHFVFLAQRLFGPASVRGALLDRELGATETRLQAELVHADTSLSIDAAVAGEGADHNRLEVVGSAGRAALIDWQLLEFQGHISTRVDSLPATLDAFAALLEGRNDHRLATVDEALAVVCTIEALLAGWEPHRAQ